MIQLTIRSGDEFLVKKVNYINLRDAIKKWNKQFFYREAFPMFSRDMLFYKDLPFDHEQEFRIVYITKESKQFENNVIEFSIDPNDLIQKITLDSRITTRAFKTFAQTFKELGYHGEIAQSQLYSLPTITFKIDH